ncbi:MAG: UDP-N-acetylmuramate--alanine ligase [Actinomycetota bacterium]|jgi:UDP-N-acetylmuramate--alanine ligase|nr:UDP-N-acetylmuramate--alanine ligase [Actinomycetota bacterium]
MNLSGVNHIHFVGVGGVGMSAIAKVLLEQGREISGSDMKRSRAFTTLEAMGADLRLGHDAAAIEGADLVVVSSAIPEGNPELKAAREQGLQVVSRGEALAAVLAGSKSIAVAGTHGKTTTTSMIVSIMEKASLDPTYLVGGGLNDAGTNARFGRGEYSVAESDESDGSFLLLSPYIGVVTNVEPDHLDYWGTFAAIEEAFERFIGAIDPAGASVLPVSEERLVSQARSRVITFGPGGDVDFDNAEVSTDGTRFDLSVGGDVRRVMLRVPGEHNVANALAAAAAGLAAGVDVDAIATGLESYRGVERRFQVRGTAAGVTVIDDYAHHPTEVRSTLAAAKSGGWTRVLAVFQPHRYSRTAHFSEAFGAAFAEADVIVITDVYGAGEEPVPGVTGKLVVDAICTNLPGRAVAYLPHRDDLIGYLTRTARPGDALLTLGAGDVTSVGEELLARLEAV